MPSSRPSRPNSNLSSLVSGASGSIPSAIIATICGHKSGAADALGELPDERLLLWLGQAREHLGRVVLAVHLLQFPQAAPQLGFILFLPFMFISNAFVPTQGMPGWLQAVANWNPFSAIAAACRALFGNPNPSALVQAWPMQHPELAVLRWSGLLLAVFAPLAVRLYTTQSR